MIDWTWTPNDSVGPFRFGGLLADVLPEFGPIPLEPDVPSPYWETYEIPGCESRLMVEEARIEGVLCCDQLLFRGKDLIGMPLPWLRVVLGTEDRLEEGARLDAAAHFDRLGATFWVVDRMVRSASTWGLDED